MLKNARMLSVTCGLALGALALPAKAQDEYEFFLVDAWWSTYNLRECRVTEINGANVASGSGTNVSGQSPGFLWTEATGKTPLLSTAPKGLNIHNIVVDNDYVLDGSTNTSTTIPGIPGFSVPRLQDVNDHGLVVGQAWAGTNCSMVSCYAPIIWDAVNGSRVLTGVPNARELVRLNNAGQLLGHIADITFDRKQAFIYESSTSTWVNLGEGLEPHWLAGHPVTEAFDISEAGSAVGIARFGQELPRAFLWDSGVRTFLPALGAGEVDYVFPRGVNSSNVVVGHANNSPSGPYRAFIWDQARGMRDLNTLTTLPTNFILAGALKINDNGWIVGHGYFGPGWATSRGFVLKPINQPPACYANCDGSSGEPVLTANDFQCFLNRFAAGDSYANCDGSTGAPVLTANDFQCFLNRFAGGCP